MAPGACQLAVKSLLRIINHPNWEYQHMLSLNHIVTRQSLMQVPSLSSPASPKQTLSGKLAPSTPQTPALCGETLPSADSGRSSQLRPSFQIHASCQVGAPTAGNPGAEGPGAAAGAMRKLDLGSPEGPTTPNPTCGSRYSPPPLRIAGSGAG